MICICKNMVLYNKQMGEKKMRKIIRKIVVITMLICAICLAGCSKEAKNETVAKKTIVAVSIVPEQTFVKAVCGDLVDIVTLVPPGSSP